MGICPAPPHHVLHGAPCTTWDVEKTFFFERLVKILKKVKMDSFSAQKDLHFIKRQQVNRP